MSVKDWMLYYNDYMREHGLITEDEHTRLVTIIKTSKY